MYISSPAKYLIAIKKKDTIHVRHVVTRTQKEEAFMKYYIIYNDLFIIYIYIK